ncbi:MAG TPA: alpha/beta fold hydrolase [Pyrinomonadaceae bacterium]|nr:alpha/beta fold hydrolase [Pyrinomonadaceae bacterium]
MSVIYKFESFVLDPAEQTLRSGDAFVQLPPRVFDTLHILVRNHGHVLRKERLLDEVWEGTFVEENNLAQAISMLRKLLRSEPGKIFIETVPKVGYRFAAAVEVSEGGPRLFPVAVKPVDYETVGSFDQPETRYVQSGEVNIAYQVVGEGPVDIVFVMGWVSHLEYFWEEPHFAAFLTKLASFSRLILFDKRGTGLSDRVPLAELPTLEQRMEDVHAVMDAVGSERAVLIGVSEGGPMCALFAATYPKRTEALVMIGTYAKRIRDEDYPWGVTMQDRDEFFELMRRDWGKPVGIEERAPSLAEDPAFRDWWATYLRMGASPGAAVALTKMNAEIDVRNILPSIRVPTLVIHRKGDLCLKVEEGRFVASQIPGCRYLELDGIDHLPFVGDQDEIVDAVREFLIGFDREPYDDRVVATVLCVKLIGSADEVQRRTAAERIRRQLELFKGHKVSADGAGIIGTFDGPARAIRCASAISDLDRSSTTGLRIGLHTGECDVQNRVYSGFAVKLAASIADVAPAGLILVSRTVKDLVAGSGFSFEEVGTQSFEGLEGNWRLFTVKR